MLRTYVFTVSVLMPTALRFLWLCSCYAFPMSTLPGQGALVVYWIPDVGIGTDPKDLEHIKVPLIDVLSYRPDVVFLFASTFTRDGKVEVDREIFLQMASAKKLQERGTKVLMSIVGSGGDSPRFGWDDITDPIAFAKSVRADIIDKYGLDGIDIDDEYGGPPDVQRFMNAVGALRAELPNLLLTKALWRDTVYFKTPVAAGLPNAGKYLAQLLDFGCTMSYAEYDEQIAAIRSYNQLGLGWNQLLIGVQAGPKEQPAMTPIDDTYKLAKWSVEPESRTKDIPPIRGMMLFTFSQDIQRFTFGRQQEKPYPDPDDHLWHRTIGAGLTGQPQPPH